MQVLVAQVEIIYLAAGLFNEKGARRHIPGAEAVLEKCIKPAGGYVSQVGSRRPQPPDAPGVLLEIGESLKVTRAPAVILVGKARSDQGIAQFGGIGYGDPSFVAPGAAAGIGPETFPSVDLINNAQNGLLADQKGYADRKNRHLVQKVGGPVQRVDDPLQVSAALFYRTFFREENSRGKQGAQCVDKQLFGLLVYVTDQAVQAFGFNLSVFHLAQFTPDEGRRLFGDSPGVLTDGCKIQFHFLLPSCRKNPGIPTNPQG